MAGERGPLRVHSYYGARARAPQNPWFLTIKRRKVVPGVLKSDGTLRLLNAQSTTSKGMKAWSVSNCASAAAGRMRLPTEKEHKESRTSCRAKKEVRTLPNSVVAKSS